MIYQIYNDDLIEGIINLIAIMFFIIGIGFSILIYQRKKSTTKIIQIILYIIGSLYSFGEVLESFTTLYIADEFGDNYELILAIIILIIGLTAFFEHKIQESEQKLYKQKIKEKLMNEQIEKLKEIDQIRNDFVRRTSHELKTPLISIYTSSKYLLESYDKELDKEILEFIKIVNRGGERLKMLTENLLAVYDLESDKFELNKKEENISKIVRECTKDMESFLKERDLVLKLDLDNSYLINIDRLKIEQVILNLLTNAIKNTPPKGIIYIGLKKKKDYIDIIIKDTGVGFTEIEKEIVFKKFGKVERKLISKNIISDGSGLGLYISNEIINMHRGKILLESDGRDKGSTFIISLPFEKD